MRHLIDIDSREQTELFVAYLLTLDISTHVEQESGTPPKWSVWIREEDRLDLANAECQAFLKSPNDPKYALAVQKARDIIQQQRLEQKQREKNLHKIRPSRRVDPYSRGRMPPITLALIVICVVFAFLTSFLHFKPTDKTAVWIDNAFSFVNDAHYQQTGDPAASLKRLELWRLFTPAFLHFGPLHLLFNMLSLASLGRLAERMEGRARYVALLILSALGAHLLQGLSPSPILGLKSLGGTPFFVGISGVVFGLFGYLAVKSKLRPDCGFFFPPDAYFMMGLILVGGIAGWLPMANLAHIGGLVSGAAIGYFWNK
jgi:GlpG protein